MKKYQFLLLDAGPIIKLFELGIWGVFIKRCDVTVSQTVADQAKWASQETVVVGRHTGLRDNKMDLVFAPVIIGVTPSR